MRQITTILKIAIVASFLFVMVPTESIIIPLWRWIAESIVSMFYISGGFPGVIFPIIILIAALYLIIAAGKSDKLNDWLCLIAISILNFPVAFTIKDLFKYPYFISRFSYLVFLILFFILLIITISRLLLNNKE
jgi:hypothetical protein